MGVQDVDDVTLIRHAYVLPERQGRGVGHGLLVHLLGLPHRPLLVGTWADAAWAVRFYERHGFRLVTPSEKDRLLRRYWRIPEAPGGDVGGAAAGVSSVLRLNGWAERHSMPPFVTVPSQTALGLHSPHPHVA